MDAGGGGAWAWFGDAVIGAWRKVFGILRRGGYVAPALVLAAGLVCWAVLSDFRVVGLLLAGVGSMWLIGVLSGLIRGVGGGP